MVRRALIVVGVLALGVIGVGAWWLFHGSPPDKAYDTIEYH